MSYLYIFLVFYLKFLYLSEDILCVMISFVTTTVTLSMAAIFGHFCFCSIHKEDCTYVRRCSFCTGNTLYRCSWSPETEVEEVLIYFTQVKVAKQQYKSAAFKVSVVEEVLRYLT